ncbi:SusC/RagA family TonB-linked outer membrane protein [Niastella caeni]|uniref:SusC/RagA family TonB-linked outer membrane protein n=1 Tax=Niastella caeni TaxID=2569763 RepID=A0A4S8HXS7_9BACT|nr:SusC/RagA family TonB-linked outer membrane protein [Niastella caeni]THU39609.1 SusC/RagA family TonB-linked outer membrane protein [Niastella caeni]
MHNFQHGKVSVLNGTEPKLNLLGRAQIWRIMKLCAFILLAGCLNVYATGYGQKITLSEKDAPLTKIFKEIQKQTGYHFLYISQQLDNAKKVTIQVKDALVDDVLQLAFREQPFGYEIREKTIVIQAKPISPTLTPEPTTPVLPEVRGVITDENGAPAQGVNVMVKGTSKGTTTNLRGEFILKDVNENAILLITSVGYDRQEILVKNKSFVTLQLRVAVGNLDEMQVIAYGTTSKRFNTGNVTTVKSTDIEKQPVTNPLLALQGRVPGMQIIQSTGLPGTGVTVRIRGRNSFENGNDPLYIVDGVPYPSQMLQGLENPITGFSGAYGPQQGRVSGSPLSYLNPGDIESIEVLKDADATAIYGTRGANGVVLITTKKGKVGPTRVDANVQYGWGKVTKFIPWLNSRQYLDMRYEAYMNDGIDPATLKPNANNYDLTLWDTTRYTDWNKQLIGGTAQYSNIQLSLYGGNSNVQYRIGYNYNKQTTVFPKSFGDPKGSLSFSINSSSNNKKLNVQLSGSYQLDKNELPNYDLSMYTNFAPNAPDLYKEDGSLNWADHPTTGFPTWENPLAKLNTRYRRRVNNLVTNAVFSYEVISGLSIKLSGGYNNMQSIESKIFPSTAYAPIYRPLVRANLWSEFAHAQNDNWILEPQITFQTRVSQGRLSALVGTTFQQNDSKAESVTAKGFNSDLVMEDPKAATSITVDNSFNATYKYNAVFARINYNYNDKYLINFTARRDGTSRFGPNKRFANFGAAGIGWVFSNENFIGKNLPILSFGKIRASYGTTGSDQVGNYRYLNLYNYLNFDVAYQNSLSLQLNGLFNPDLAWEETKKLEGAIELGFWKDRIFLSVSHYRNRSFNQLTTYSLPSNTGTTGGIPANLDATIENTGWEVTLSSTNFQSKNFKWTSSINLSVPRNKLVSVGPNTPNIDDRLVGHSTSTRFVYSFAGVDPVTGRYQFYDGKGGFTFQPDTAYEPGSFGRYTEYALNTDVTYFGGFQNGFSWKQFQVDFLFSFEKRLGETNQRGNIPGSFSLPSRQNQPVSVLDRWQKPGDNASVQKYNQDYSIYKQFEAYTQSDGAWMDASYIRLKNVSLSWQLPTRIKQRVHLQNARLYTQAQNLFVITKYKGSDPETRSLISLPPLRIWTVGCQLTF